MQVKVFFIFIDIINVSYYQFSNNSIYGFSNKQ